MSARRCRFYNKTNVQVARPAVRVRRVQSKTHCAIGDGQYVYIYMCIENVDNHGNNYTDHNYICVRHIYICI